MNTFFVLTVFLSLTNMPQVWLTEVHPSKEECIRWANFYNEYPFIAVCTEVKEKEK